MKTDFLIEYHAELFIFADNLKETVNLFQKQSLNSTNTILQNGKRPYLFS